MDLGALWSTTIIVADASPGGHGLAYCTAPYGTVLDWGRVVAHRGDYHIILQDSNLEAPEAKHQRLQGAILPLGAYHWHTIGRPGGW